MVLEKQIHETLFLDFEVSKIPSDKLLESPIKSSLETLPEHLPPVPLETLAEQLPPDFLKMQIQDYMVAFSGHSKSFCVGVVDMVDSTRISSRLSPNQNSKYYEIFLNTMARVINRFGGMILKNVGDSLVFYFPESSKGRHFGFLACFEGCLAMVDSHKFIEGITKKEGLPQINYRVSCDYGPVVIMKQYESSNIDMIGPSMNICCKINRLAPNNGFVIGADLYEIAKKYQEYNFLQKGKYDSDLKSSYSVYLVSRK